MAGSRLLNAFIEFSKSVNLPGLRTMAAIELEEAIKELVALPLGEDLSHISVKSIRVDFIENSEEETRDITFTMPSDIAEAELDEAISLLLGIREARFGSQIGAIDTQDEPWRREPLEGYPSAYDKLQRMIKAQAQKIQALSSAGDGLSGISKARFDLLYKEALAQIAEAELDEAIDEPLEVAQYGNLAEAIQDVIEHTVKDKTWLDGHMFYDVSDYETHQGRVGALDVNPDWIIFESDPGEGKLAHRFRLSREIAGNLGRWLVHHTYSVQVEMGGAKGAGKVSGIPEFVEGGSLVNPRFAYPTGAAYGQWFAASDTPEGIKFELYSFRYHHLFNWSKEFSAELGRWLLYHTESEQKMVVMSASKAGKMIELLKSLRVNDEVKLKEKEQEIERLRSKVASYHYAAAIMLGDKGFKTFEPLQDQAYKILFGVTEGYRERFYVLSSAVQDNMRKHGLDPDSLSRAAHDLRNRSLNPLPLFGFSHLYEAAAEAESEAVSREKLINAAKTWDNFTGDISRFGGTGNFFAQMHPKGLSVSITAPGDDLDFEISYREAERLARWLLSQEVIGLGARDENMQALEREIQLMNAELRACQKTIDRLPGDLSGLFIDLLHSERMGYEQDIEKPKAFEDTVWYDGDSYQARIVVQGMGILFDLDSENDEAPVYAMSLSGIEALGRWINARAVPHLNWLANKPKDDNN